MSPVNKHYIRGFFDGEGTVTNTIIRGNVTPRVSISNTHLPILLKIKEYLQKQDFHPHLYRRERPKHPEYKISYDLQLTKWSEVIRFYNEIGTSHSDKQAMFEKLIAADKVRPRRGWSRGKTSTVKVAEQILRDSRGIKKNGS